MAGCKGSTEYKQIEVKSLNILNSGEYEIILPDGNYDVVASTYGKNTLEDDIDITADSDTELNITF